MDRQNPSARSGPLVPIQCTGGARHRGPSSCFDLLRTGDRFPHLCDLHSARHIEGDQAPHDCRQCHVGADFRRLRHTGLRARSRPGQYIGGAAPNLSLGRIPVRRRGLDAVYRPLDRYYLAFGSASHRLPRGGLRRHHHADEEQPYGEYERRLCQNGFGERVELAPCDLRPRTQELSDPHGHEYRKPARHFRDRQLPDRARVQHPGHRATGLRGHPNARLSRGHGHPGHRQRTAAAGKLGFGFGGGFRRPPRTIRVAGMAWIKLDPITRRRFARFRKIKRGYYSFLILAAAIVLSIFAPYLAESRAVMVVHQGKLFFPTFEFLDMGTFGQTPPPGWSTADLETDYLRLKHEWQAERYYYGKESKQAGGDAQEQAALEKKYPNRNSVVVMPPIPWDPYQNDFWYNEILHDIQPLLDAGRRDEAERLASRGPLDELAGECT